MTDKVRTYRGYTIERTFPSGYWAALIDTPRYSGYVKADTLDGLKDLIRYYVTRHD